MSDTSVVIDFFARQNELALLYWIFAATLALILLFFIARVVRNIVAHRVRQIEEFGMDFDAVAEMLDRGLLTPEEAQRVKSVLARHFSRLHQRKFSPKTEDAETLSPESIAATLAPGAKPAPSAEVPFRPPGKPAVAAPGAEKAGGKAPGAAGGREIAPAAKPSGPEEKTPEVELPLDILDMYQAGMITPEELDALRRFYAERAKAGGRNAPGRS